MFIPRIDGNLRSHMVKVPEVINEVGGISIFGKKIRSLVFSTDVALIRNINANAVIAVYPFTPQPIITHAIISSSDIPVFCGIGGGTTKGDRVVELAQDAEFQGAMGVVINSPTENETIILLKKRIDIPIIVTVVSENTDFQSRIEAGVEIFNVSAAANTAKVVKYIRDRYPEFPIIATGGPDDGSILETIKAGANAITYTPPSTAQIFKGMMAKYRNISL